MPTLTRWFAKTALVYFVLALLTALLLAARPLIELPLFVAFLGPVYLHLLVVGWISQLIFGVAYWFFPIYTRDAPRGSELLGWTTYAGLNVGLLLRAVSEPAVALNPGAAWGWLLALAALLQWIAGLAFVANTWGRVKSKRG